MAEKEHIEREAALRVLCDACGNAACPKGLIPRCSYYEKMQSVPAADVRPVVLCRDCKWCHAGYCEKYDDLIPFGCANKPWEDWFCADGEKKEER